MGILKRIRAWVTLYPRKQKPWLFMNMESPIFNTLQRVQRFLPVAEAVAIAMPSPI